MIRVNAANTCWWVLYVACMLAVVGGMRTARHWSGAAYGTDAAQAQWQDWRSAVESQRAQGQTRVHPVRRRVPQSAQPPALVLMRDHFEACLVFAVILSSTLFLTAMVALRGAFRTTSEAMSE